MSKRTFSRMIPAIVVGTLVFIASVANAQEGMMKGKHEKGMMSHTCMKGEKHHGGHKFFLGMQDELGLSYLFVSHDMAVVERVSHYVGVMYLGRMVEMGH
ncbi:MAG: hypothetical protein IIB44_03430 [Candidatus Marinimicrobia bacterium]|nr:hypothetical protein [Candidatus Neomarinimicrobiota bacterium]